MKESNTKTNDKKIRNLRFWIPFILITLVSLLFLFINESTLAGWGIFFVVIIAVVIKRKTLLNLKWVIRAVSWILIVVILCVSSGFTKPPIIDVPASTFGKSLPTEAVTTENGLVSGIYNSDKSVRIFAGIPYAAPPIGDLRWKAPQPPKSWTGVRTSDHFSDSPMQTRTPAFLHKIMYSLLGTDALSSSVIKNNEALSEDCLYLNVWSSAKSNKEKQPVIVYIYGGSYTSGSGSIDAYNGENMAKKGVVYVTLNYRFGVFGFMAHPDLTKESAYNASGNYGILDQVAALKWVKNNIEAFGGDPNNVTIAGESAGSISVSILQASPLAKNLFQKAIGESCAVFGSRGIKGGPTLTLSEAEKTGVKFSESQKMASIDDLRKMPAKDLLKAAKKESMRPIEDGYVLPDSVYNIFEKGKQNDVPILVGSNADEGTLFVSLPWPASTAVKADKFKDQVKQTYGNKATEFLELYPASTDKEAVNSQIESIKDQCFAWQVHTWANLQSKTGKSKAFYYYFSHLQPGPSSFQKLGVYHSSEIAYAYGNLDKLNLPYTDADKKLSNIMSTYWINFARTGDPNGNNLPNWIPYDEKTDETMMLGDVIGSVPTPHKENLKFFDDYEASLRKK